jgi:hypothetical protein
MAKTPSNCYCTFNTQKEATKKTIFSDDVYLTAKSQIFYFISANHSTVLQNIVLSLVKVKDLFLQISFKVKLS